MSVSVVPHNVSPIRRKAILREHVAREELDQVAREHEGADPVSLGYVESLPALSNGQRNACAITAWMVYGAICLMTGFIAAYSIVTLVGIAAGLA